MNAAAPAMHHEGKGENKLKQQLHISNSVPLPPTPVAKTPRLPPKKITKHFYAITK
jgi:hypothetical protein